MQLFISEKENMRLPRLDQSEENPWQWAFPATCMYVDPRTGERRRRHHHESVLQRASRKQFDGKVLQSGRVAGAQ